ncbi:hypothetical protein cyc_00687 [Cyclospora cayetanensis]|uniref:Uncharacterized protein n=1 Tax=Cyclospora cayetanensis TaxID=88456 RepID=A0A1D3CRA1_9EIME|nr:hypothetical protein cyc_00687 [Cyclospora cayetanensis]
MLSDSGSSSESEGAADLLESILGVSGSSQGAVAGRKKSEASCQRQQESGKVSAQKEASLETKCRHENKTERAASVQEEPHQPPQQPPQHLKLDLKGLPLQVGPRCANSHGVGPFVLQPHQKVLRLSIDGDPNADPAELLSAYIASLGDIQQQRTTAVTADKQIQVKGVWYAVQRDASRGELLLGAEPSDTQLLTPERHLGHLRFVRCEAPEENGVQGESEEVSGVS